MANKLTLDEIFDTWCKCESPRHRNPMSSDTLTNHTCNTLILRQQFLQWVADEVIITTFEGLDRWKNDETRTSLTRHDIYIQGQNQRQILKAHGWKES